MKKIRITSPHGVGIELAGGELILDRQNPDARFIDVRDSSLPRDEGGYYAYVAQVPTDWLIEVIER